MNRPSVCSFVPLQTTLRRAATILAVAFAVISCGGSATPSGAGGTNGGFCDPAGDAWLTSTQSVNDGAIIIEKVSYCSEGLRINGQICRPARDGRFPLVMSNHGGIDGLGDDANNPTGGCATAARGGFVVAASSYRGEDGSDGAPEICLGEVTDVLRMLEIARRQTYVDGARVAMLGLSHGGCITLGALARGPILRAAAAVFPPTDWTTTYAHWQKELTGNTDAATRVALEALSRALLVVTGGTPDDARPNVRQAYSARSPMTVASRVAASSVPLFIAHGTTDALVPYGDSCRFASMLGDVWAYAVGGDGSLLMPIAPPDCANAGLSWHAGSPPRGSWTAQRHLGIYVGAGHEGASPAAKWMLLDAFDFVNRKI